MALALFHCEEETSDYKQTDHWLHPISQPPSCKPNQTERGGRQDKPTRGSQLLLVNTHQHSFGLDCSRQRVQSIFNQSTERNEHKIYKIDYVGFEGQLNTEYRSEIW